MNGRKLYASISYHFNPLCTAICHSVSLVKNLWSMIVETKICGAWSWRFGFWEAEVKSAVEQRGNLCGPPGDNVPWIRNRNTTFLGALLRYCIYGILYLISFLYHAPIVTGLHVLFWFACITCLYCIDRDIHERYNVYLLVPWMSFSLFHTHLKKIELVQGPKNVVLPSFSPSLMDLKGKSGFFCSFFRKHLNASNCSRINRLFIYLEKRTSADK